MIKKNTGRNDPCICKSGRTFKHCCLIKIKTKKYPRFFTEVRPGEWQLTLFVRIDKPNGIVKSRLINGKTNILKEYTEKQCENKVKIKKWAEISLAEAVLKFDCLDV